MNKTGVRFNCPRCKYEIDFDKILYHDMENEIKLKYKSKVDKLQERLSFYEEKEKNIYKRILYFPN